MFIAERDDFVISSLWCKRRKEAQKNRVGRGIDMLDYFLFALILLQDDIIYVLLTLFFNLSYSGLLIVGVSFFRIRS